MNIIKNHRISRRTMLRGMGAALALPALDIMAPARAAAAAKPPVRMACIYFPNGVWEKAWIPEASGTDFALPYSLEPLEALRGDINIFSGLDKAASRQGDGHYAKTANFLTGEPVAKTTGRNISAGGISLDQLAAQHVGGQTISPGVRPPSRSLGKSTPALSMSASSATAPNMDSATTATAACWTSRSKTPGSSAAGSAATTRSSWTSTWRPCARSRSGSSLP